MWARFRAVCTEIFSFIIFFSTNVFVIPISHLFFLRYFHYYFLQLPQMIVTLCNDSPIMRHPHVTQPSVQGQRDQHIRQFSRNN